MPLHRRGSRADKRHRTSQRHPTELYEYDSLDGFLEVFWLVQSTLCTRADWTRLAYEPSSTAPPTGSSTRNASSPPPPPPRGGPSLRDIVAGLDEGIAAGEKETGSTCLLIADMDRAFGPAAGRRLVEELASLRRVGTPGADRVIATGMDSTELGIDSTTFLHGYDLTRSSGFRLTGHQGENSAASDIAACLDVLGLERIDHGVPVLDDVGLTRRMADAQIPITVCPTSNVVIARCFDRLEDQAQAPWSRSSRASALVNELRRREAHARMRHRRARDAGGMWGTKARLGWYKSVWSWRSWGTCARSILSGRPATKRPAQRDPSQRTPGTLG